MKTIPFILICCALLIMLGFNIRELLGLVIIAATQQWCWKNYYKKYKLMYFPYICFSLILLIGYVFKYISIKILNSDSLDKLFYGLQREKIENVDLQSATLIAVILACISLVLTLKIGGYLWKNNLIEIEKPAKDAISEKQVKLLMGLCVLMSAISGYLQFHYGIFILGQDMVKMPYKIGSMIIYTRTLIVPFILTFCFYFAIKNKRRYLSTIIVGLLIVHGISQMVIMASRGVILVLLMPLIFMLLFEYGFNKKIRSYALIFITALILTRPFFTILRSHRTENANLISQIKDTLEGNYSMLPEDITLNAVWYIVRISGYENLLTAISAHPNNIFDYSKLFDVLSSKYTFTDKYTMDVAGYSKDVLSYHHTAPSLLGGLYYLGGYSFLVIGIIMFFTITMFLWRILIRSKLKSKYFQLLIFSTYFTLLIQEGNLELIKRYVLFIMITITIGEWLLKGRMYENEM